MIYLALYVSCMACAAICFAVRLGRFRTHLAQEPLRSAAAVALAQAELQYVRVLPLAISATSSPQNPASRGERGAGGEGLRLGAA